MSYLVQASPYSKIFMPEWEAKCVANPELVAQSEPGLFTVRVPRASGGLVFEHLKPVHSGTLIKRNGTRQIEDDEITPLVEWLTGGEMKRPCEETDIYGVVMIDVGGQFESTLQELLQLTMESQTGKNTESALKKIAANQKKIVTDMASRLKEATEEANKRVKRAMTATHNNLLKSWETLQSEGKGQYTPSTQEALGYHILKVEVDRQLDLNRKLYNNVAEGIPGARRA